MANIAYIRVSSLSQNSGRQYELLSKYAINIDRVYEDKISGKNIDEREQLKAMLSYVREGDVVYIESISRLARSVSDFLHLVKVIQSKGVELVSLKENIDTTTPQGKFITTVFAALYEMERATIRERQREGIDLCLKEGRNYGRPKTKFSPSFAKNYMKYKAGDLQPNEFMNLEGIKARSSFYSLIKKYEERVLLLKKQC